MLALALPACSEEASPDDARVLTVSQAVTLEGLAGPALSPWPMLGGSSLRTGRSSFAGPQSAATLWEASLRRLLLSRNVRSSPVLDVDGTVLLGSDSRFLFAFHPDGTRKWRVDLGGNVRSTPAVTASGTILVGSDANRLHALDRTGAPRWTFRALASIRSSPLVTVAGDIVFGSDDFRVYCLGPDGTEKWRFKTWGRVRASPAATLDGVVYAASNDGNLYALDGEAGTERWRVRLGLLHEPTSPAIAADGTVYVAFARSLFAIDPGGSVRWKFTAPSGTVRSSPAIASDGTILFGSDDRHLYAVRPDGTMKWRFAAGAAVRSSPVLGLAGTIYFGTDAGELFALRDGGAAPAVVWSHPMGGKVRASGAIAPGGRLYAPSDAGRLVAFTTEGQLDEASCLESAIATVCPCLCTSCLSAFDGCGADVGCLAIFGCALESECRGMECYLPEKCQDVMDDFGGPAGEAALRAGRLSDCLTEQCPECG